MSDLKKIITLTAKVDDEKLFERKITVFTDSVDLKDIGNFLVDIGEALKETLKARSRK